MPIQNIAAELGILKLPWAVHCDWTMTEWHLIDKKTSEILHLIIVSMETEIREDMKFQA